MKMICSICGRDLNEIWQSNMSTIPGYIVCEDCAKDRPQFRKKEGKIFNDRRRMARKRQ